MKKQSDTDDLYTLLIKSPVQSKEYQECISKLRRIETGGHTLGMNLALEQVQASKEVVEYNISKAL